MFYGFFELLLGFSQHLPTRHICKAAPKTVKFLRSSSGLKPQPGIKAQSLLTRPKALGGPNAPELPAGSQAANRICFSSCAINKLSTPATKWSIMV